jgi:fructokinase
MSAPIAAIEAGGTKFLCAVARGREIVAEMRIATTTPAATIGAALEFFASAAAAHGALAALGVATFGPVDLHGASPTFGHMLETPKPGWAGADLLWPLRRRFRCPVAIDTDVNAAALAEALEGAGRGCGTVVYVTVGTGIGGGIVVDDRTLKGRLHPEIGHMLVLRHARDAAFAGTCPFHGHCAEGLASGSAIQARYGAPLDRLPLDHEAHGVVAHYLGQLAATILLMLSPDRIVFGGGVMQCEGLLANVRAVAATLLNGYAGFGRGGDALADVVVAPGLGTRSGLLGALILAERARGSAPARGAAPADCAGEAPPEVR